ncbi:GatB/YqeY domain-containing protein [Candidatus Azambacteria bacterium]|nr:GatB/YqeY domain-containing protein [Candidatus Azambacteria bacterium]
MNIKEAVNSDFKEAFKAGDAVAKSVLAMLKSEIKNKEIDNKGSELSEEQTIDLINYEVKKRKDSIRQYSDAGRNDLAESEQAEIGVLMKYLPAQLSEEEIRKTVERAIAETGASGLPDLGKVMANLKPKVKGKADGSLVANIVKETLSK